MPLQHTPKKGSAQTYESETHRWEVTIDGRREFVEVNPNQNQYLTLATTTNEQKKEFLLRILEARRQAAAATTTAEAEVAHATASRTIHANTDPIEALRDRADQMETMRSQVNSPTPTDKSVEDIKERTRLLEESIIKEAAKATNKAENDLQKEEGKACRDRQHEFVLRTQTFLATPAKQFVKAVNMLKVQLDQQKGSDEISRQYGDELLKKVHDLYNKVEQAREYCEEVLEEDERLQHEYYMKNKFEDVCECERIHRKYFEKQEQNQRLKNPRSQVQPPYVAHPPTYTSAPPRFVATTATNSRPVVTTAPGAQFRPQQGHSQQWQHQQYNSFFEPQFRQPPMMSTPYPRNTRPYQPSNQQFSPVPAPRLEFTQQYQNNQPGFNVYQDPSHGNRLPPQSALDTHNPRQPRFKLNEELALVEKFDASNPRSYMAFRAQWTNFMGKMEREQRSTLDTYYALLKVLGGTAYDLAKVQYPNDQSYAQAIQKLDKTFFNPTNLLREMVQKLLKGQKMHDTYESLLGGMNKLWDAWSDLDQADLTKDQLKGLLFIAATEKNLSEESWKCWLDVQNHERYKENPMAAFEISTYLGAINTAMVNAQRRKNAIGSRENHLKPPPRPGKKQSTLFGSYHVQNKQKNNPPSVQLQKQARKPGGLCIMCGQNPHKYQLNCPRLKNMTVNEIYNAMTKYGINCQMCLALGHRTRECPDLKEGRLKPCHVKEDGQNPCNKNHCRYLHKSKKANEEPKQTPPSKQD